MAGKGSSSSSRGPYDSRRPKGGMRNKGKGKDWAMSDDCLQSIVGGSRSAIVGLSSSAIVGGSMHAAGPGYVWERLPPPPPAPPANAGDWGPRQPDSPPESLDYPPKARPRPRPPAGAPPDDVLAKNEVDPQEELEDVEDGEAATVWTIEVIPEPPVLSGANRPEYVQSVREWLRTSFSVMELEVLMS